MLHKKGIKLFISLLILIGFIIIFATFNSPGASKNKEEHITFNFGSMDGPEHVQNKETFPKFAKKAEELTENKVDFRMYLGGSLGGPDETLDNTITGLMDVSRGIHGYNAGRYPVQSVMNLPFLADGNGEELSVVAQELYDTFPEIQDEYQDVKPLWIHASDPYAIITKDKPVRSFEDVQGLKLRTPSLEGSKMIRSWGANPVSLGAPEIYDALQKGTIDGGVLPVAAIKDFNLADTVDYVTIGHFNTNLFYVSMNQNSWDRFTNEEKESLENDVLGEPMARQSGVEFEKQKEKAEKEAKEAGVEFIDLSDEELKEFQDASKVVKEDWIKNMEEEGIDGQKIYDEAERLVNEIEDKEDDN